MRDALLISLLLAALSLAAARNVLFIITPGPQSHMYGMRKIALEMASRQHHVLVRCYLKL